MYYIHEQKPEEVYAKINESRKNCTVFKLIPM